MTDDITVELAVKVEDKSSLTKFLQKLDGVRVLGTTQLSVIIGLNTESNMGISDIQNIIEKEYKITTVVQGVGETVSAVSQLCPSSGAGDQIYGLVRISQLNAHRCYFDGVLSGISNTDASYSANLHSYGDLSGRSFQNIGSPVLKVKDNIPISAPANGSNHELRLRTEVIDCDLSLMIGRALAITKSLSPESLVVSAGIVSRASTVGANRKRICTCSGKTIWEEREEVK